MNTSRGGNEEDFIFIGTKPFMNYVTAIVVSFTSKEKNSLTVRARGKFIVRAIDVVEAVRKKFLKDKNIQIGEVKIGSDEVERKDGKKINVSTIEIFLERKN